MYKEETIYILLVTVAITDSLKCYVGSKGVVNNVPSSNFVANNCEDGMKHCFESFTDDMTEITASCQTPNTEHKLLDVCQVGCQNYTSLELTVCCCNTDLCNLPDSEKPTNATSTVELSRQRLLKGVKLPKSKV
ncbi:unnamed protein product [Cylicocyclus nassatus]|uniref:Uncharacterized protein n=1 Tax=Cylicocyclus nassatus TaxID=53992 RepID=A0AA36GX89_CYLNA|nr:unnamed protein product [Cylicocyclus nassatus]